MENTGVLEREVAFHRYYDPATEQFLSVDPLVNDTGMPYAFTGGNPVNAIDPSGLDPQDLATAVTGFLNQLAEPVQVAEGLAKNPIVQGVVTVGTCTVTDGIACYAANAGFVSLNAYDRYQADGGVSSAKFWVGTVLDAGAAAVNLQALKGLKGDAIEFQDQWGSPIVKGKIYGYRDIPGSIFLKVVGHNILIGGGAAGLDYVLQSFLGTC